MNFSTLILVLVSAFGWSLFDISRKKTGARLSPPVALMFYMILSLPFVVTWALLTSTELHASYWLVGTLGIAINFLANWTFIESVSRSPLSSSIPMLAFVPAFSGLLSIVFLGESLATGQWIGIAFVVLGAFLLDGFPKFKGAHAGPWLMFVASIFWSVMLVIDKLSLRSASPPMHITIQTIGMLFIAWVWVRFKKVPVSFSQAMRLDGFYLWVGVLGCVVGAGAQLVAIAHTDIGMVESLKRAADMALSLVWGAVLFGEAVSIRKIVPIGVLLLGTFLVLQVI